MSSESGSSLRFCEQCGAPAPGSQERVACWSCLLLDGTGKNVEPEILASNTDEIFQHYEILKHEDGRPWELGRGAMGVTYKAIDKNLQVIVALKVINARLSIEPDAPRRFLREARTAARLIHPNVAVIFHFGEISGHEPSGPHPSPANCFYAMEFVEGETLEVHLQRAGTLPAAFAVEVALQVCRALIAAEKRGLVHCDLKPSNIMLVAGADEDQLPRHEAWVKVIDFGLAKAVSTASDGGDPAQSASFEGWGGRTSFVGTPQFASPEQLRGEALDVRSDIFSLGATLWYAMTGELPFHGDSIAEIQRRQREQTFLSSLVAKEIPAPVLALLGSMLAEDSSRRPASGQALENELQTCLRALGKASVDVDHNERKQPPRDSEALRLFRCAQGAVQGSFEVQSRCEEAIRFLEQALARDPNFVPARARLAEMHALMFRNSYDRSPVRAEQARAEAEAALRLDPQSSEAHRAMGIYHHHVRLDYVQASAELTLACKFQPDDAENLFYLGSTACRQSRWEEGLAFFRQAAEREPYRLDYVNQLWRTLADMRRYGEARQVLTDLIARRPEDIQHRVNLAYLSYSESADLQPLRDVLAQAPADYDPDGYMTFLRNGLARYNNDPDEAERILEASPFQQFRGFVDGQIFPRSALEFLNALLRGDMEKTRRLAEAGRPGVLFYIQMLPDQPGPLLLLASFDAILGRREEAIEVGRRGLAMLPVEKDGVDGPKLGIQLAWAYFHLGEFDAGIDLLRTYTRYPGAATYGELRLGDVYRKACGYPPFESFLETQR